MVDAGGVVTPADFQVWARTNEQIQRQKGVLAALPPYATTYDPTVVPNMGKVLIQNGITGAAGYYYPPSDPVTP
jgi:hypothetical protein